MKRRLALLLALSLTFASFSVAGVSATEADTSVAAGQVTETETEVEQEETEAATENEEAEVASDSEAATEAASTTEVTETTESTESGTSTEEAEAVEETEEEAEVVEETTEDAADATTGSTSDEVAAVVEPAVEAEAVTKTAEDAKTSTLVGWQYSGGNAYFYKNGQKVTGIQYLPYHGVTRTFFFDSNGVKQTGWVTIDNKGTVCYFADSRYTALPPGAMVTGFHKIGNYWFYMADATYAKQHGVTRGKQMTGWQYINNRTYYFKPAGGGSYPTGAAYTGWKSVGGNLYYFADSNYTAFHEGAMLTGWKTIKGKTFFFADSRYPSQTRGTLVKGLVKLGNNYFMFASNGQQVKGWTTYNGRMAYYDTSSGAGKKGWHAKGSSWYWTYNTGLARYGWIKLGNSLYYLNPAQGGKMATGSVLMESGALMFFDSEGHRATTTGWQTVGNYSYYTYSNGTCARNTTIDGVKLDSMGRSTMSAMDRKAQGYSSNTNYLILVNKGEYKVCVYKGKKNAWVKLKEWYCTHGGSNTPSGTWTIDDHVTKRSATYGWAVFDYSSAAFATHISAGNYFHSILYEKYIGLYYPNTNPYSEDPMDPALKKSYSHGCIRLETANAEWIWDNVPLGTKVVVY